MAYYDSTNGNLKTAHCSDLDCFDATNVATESSGDVGIWTSITKGSDGMPLIVYHDVANGDLKAAHCSNVFCAPYFRRD